MISFGTYNVPAGTWSDDSSLTFCLAEALCVDFDLQVIGDNFVKWYLHNYWTPWGNVFDIGIATKVAIKRLADGIKPEYAGNTEEDANGNGSLMRIAPLLFYIMDLPIKERYEQVRLVSAITHGHIRSIIACFYYLEFARLLYVKQDKFDIYKQLQVTITSFLNTLQIPDSELDLWDRLLLKNIYELSIDQIQSTGYVMHTLEASIWCLMTTNSYKEPVVKAVNLGDDTDTTGAVTGALAGLLYGLDQIFLKNG